MIIQYYVGTVRLLDESPYKPKRKLIRQAFRISLLKLIGLGSNIYLEVLYSGGMNSKGFNLFFELLFFSFFI